MASENAQLIHDAYKYTKKVIDLIKSLRIKSSEILILENREWDLDQAYTKFTKSIAYYRREVENVKMRIKNNLEKGEALIPEEICKEIATALPKYEIVSWIDQSELDWGDICELPEAIDFIKENIEKVNWEALCANPHPSALELIRMYPDNIDWVRLLQNENPDIALVINEVLYKETWIKLFGSECSCDEKLFPKQSIYSFEKIINEIKNVQQYQNIFTKPTITPLTIHFLKTNLKLIECQGISLNPNPETIKLLIDNPETICWSLLSMNSGAVHFLKENPDKIEWYGLSFNENPEAIELLKTRPEKIDWVNLSGNCCSEAIKILKNNKDKINWTELSSNTNPEALEMLRENSGKIDWDFLFGNSAPKAVEIIKENLDKIDRYISYWTLSSNPAIFRPVADKELFKVLIGL